MYAPSVEASVIWLNYNSSNFLRIALKSLESVLSIDLNGSLEVILVDNASTDGSFKVLKEFAERKKPSNVRLKTVELRRNKGYSGGMNAGWDAISPNSKYVAFLNNDLIVEPRSLSELIDFMRSSGVSAASGLVYYGDGRTIYSAGCFVTELWGTSGICMTLPETECSTLSRPHYVTYADGSYMVVSVEAVREVGYLGRPFIDEAFIFLDDYLLGLLLWNRGKRVAYFPVKAGYHFSHKTIKPVIFNYSIRAEAALSRILRTRFSRISHLYMSGILLFHIFLNAFNRKMVYEIIRNFFNGYRLGENVREKIGTLSLYRAPFIRITPVKFRKPAIPTHSDLVYYGE
jgi:GT2 family glycosyltransferase